MADDCDVPVAELLFASGVGGVPSNGGVENLFHSGEFFPRGGFPPRPPALAAPACSFGCVRALFRHCPGRP
jgi:hypothetical protein